MKRLAFAVPGDLATATGGFAYDRRMIGELQQLGWTVDVLNLGDGFPCPAAPVKAAARARLAAVPSGRLIVVDGLAFGVLPETAGELRSRNPLIALVHMPLALHPGLGTAATDPMRESERAALACARHVVVTSPMTARVLAADYGVPADQLTVARPGTDRVPARPRAETVEVSLLAVGSVVPGKGYDVLIAALAELGDLPWHLVIVGDRGHSRDTAQAVDARIAQLALGPRIRFTGALPPDQVAAHYESADLFVLPSRFETYGMVYAEAMAHGLPIVATVAGAIPETVPAGAGVLVPIDDITALAAALRRLIESPAERARLAAGARAAGAAFPSWRETAMVFSQVLERFA